ncbi:MAG: site-specific integrase [Candidatus Obscuribacterales bacterium]|nr:site-specific integrase [Candidatus Obscuribacterales bacterium]
MEQLVARFLTYLRIKGLSAERVQGFETVVKQVIDLETEARKPQQDNERLTLAQAQQLIDAANSSKLPRDAALIKLILLQGLNLSECRFLKFKHTDEPLRLSFTTYANHRTRQLQLRPDGMQAVAIRLGSPQRKAIESDYVFAAFNAGPLSRTAMDNQNSQDRIRYKNGSDTANGVSRLLQIIRKPFLTRRKTPQGIGLSNAQPNSALVSKEEIGIKIA